MKWKNSIENKDNNESKDITKETKEINKYNI